LPGNLEKGQPERVVLFVIIKKLKVATLTSPSGHKPINMVVKKQPPRRLV